MSSYRAKKNGVLTAEQVMRYGPRVQVLADKNGGQVTAADILADATKKKSPLHDFFDWDDTTAANQFRLSQARKMVQAIEIVYEDASGNRRNSRAFHSIPVSGPSRGHRPENAYIPVSRMMEDEEIRAEVIDQYRRRISALRRELRKIEGMDEVCRVLEEAETALETVS